MLRLTGPALASLACLTLNFCFLSILIHISRTRVKPGEARYKASSAVVLTEVGKLVVSVVLALREVEHAHAMTPPPASSPRPQHSHVDVNEPAQHGLGISDAAVKQRVLYDPPPDRPPADDAGPSTPKMGFAGMAAVPSPAESPTQRRLRGQSIVGPGRGAQSHARSSSIALSSRAGTPLVQDSPDPALDDTPESSASPWPSHDLISQFRRLHRHVTAGDYWQLALPAFCFTLQAQLQYLAIANLSVPAYQITAQLKILTTALCAVVMLGRRLSLQQWAALCALAAGVAIVQLSATSEDSGHHAHVSEDGPVLRPWLGFSAVLASALSSGFASTYFERTLKAAAPTANGTPAGAAEERPAAPATGLWVRNVQLSLFSLAMGFGMNVIESNADLLVGRWYGTAAEAAMRSAAASMAPKDSSPLGALSSFFAGFSPIVWLVIALQIFGGVLAALVIKHADNILKVFATSLSIVLSFALSVALFSFELTPGAVVGAALVVGSTFAFAAPSRRPSVAHKLVPNGTPRGP